MESSVIGLVAQVICNRMPERPRVPVAEKVGSDSTFARTGRGIALWGKVESDPTFPTFCPMAAMH